jgi:hypothetical protein
MESPSNVARTSRRKNFEYASKHRRALFDRKYWRLHFQIFGCLNCSSNAATYQGDGFCKPCYGRLVWQARRSRQSKSH